MKSARPLIIFRASSFIYPECVLYLFLRTRTHPRLIRDGLKRSAPGLKVGKIFVWIRRNPLKSPDSAKGIQGNASLFPWISLDLFGVNYRRSYVLSAAKP